MPAEPEPQPLDDEGADRGGAEARLGSGESDLASERFVWRRGYERPRRQFLRVRASRRSAALVDGRREGPAVSHQPGGVQAAGGRDGREGPPLEDPQAAHPFGHHSHARWHTLET